MYIVLNGTDRDGLNSEIDQALNDVYLRKLLKNKSDMTIRLELDGNLLKVWTTKDFFAIADAQQLAKENALVALNGG